MLELGGLVVVVVLELDGAEQDWDSPTTAAPPGTSAEAGVPGATPLKVSVWPSASVTVTVQVSALADGTITRPATTAPAAMAFLRFLRQNNLF